MRTLSTGRRKMPSAAPSLAAPAAKPWPEARTSVDSHQIFQCVGLRGLASRTRSRARPRWRWEWPRLLAPWRREDSMVRWYDRGAVRSARTRGAETVPRRNTRERMSKHHGSRMPDRAGTAAPMTGQRPARPGALRLLHRAGLRRLRLHVLLHLHGIEFSLVIVLTLVIAVVATFVHVKAGRRTRVDSLVDKGL